jgi:hypothetical protein
MVEKLLFRQEKNVGRIEQERIWRDNKFQIVGLNRYNNELHCIAKKEQIPNNVCTVQNPTYVQWLVTGSESSTSIGTKNYTLLGDITCRQFRHIYNVTEIQCTEI